MNRRFFSNASYSAAQTVVSALLLFFLYRFLLKALGPEQLGVWAVVLSSTSVARLSDMGFSGAAVKFVARTLANGDRETASKVVQTAGLTIGTVLALLLLLIYPLLQQLLNWVIPANALQLAKTILPLAVCSLWFGMVAGIFQSALDGCQRMDLRNLILIFGNVVYLGSAFWLVPHYGLEGLAKGQLVQSVGLALLSWLAIRKQLDMPWLPHVWTKALFKEMFAYAVNFQISSLASMLFEPTIKFLLTKFGGLSQTGYYEMASQLVMKVRAIVISGFQALVPVIAGIDNDDHEQITEMYRKSYRAISFIAVPYFMTIVMALPIISLLWIGRLEPRFVVFGTLLCIGWMLTNIGVPAYFHNIGIGHLSWNTYNHLLTALLSLSLGTVLGTFFGGYAVVGSAMFALVFSNALLALAVQKHLGVSLSDLLPVEHRSLSLVITLGAVMGYSVYYFTHLSLNLYGASVFMLLVYVIVSVAGLWRHPYRKQLLLRYQSR